MPTDPNPSVIDHDDPQPLLGLLDPFPGPVVVGFEPAGGHVELHAAPLPEDDRAGAAGLFGAHARSDWSAVGVAFEGRARHLTTRQELGGGASAAVVVTRAGRRASRLHLEGADPAPGSGDVAEGLVVDALHRMLGLPSPGEAPHHAQLALAGWAHLVLQTLLDQGDLSWEQAVRLHPGVPRHAAVAPSIETLVEATVRTFDGLRWSHLHAGAVRRSSGAYDLTPAEAAWMDTTMFARWVLGAFAEPATVVHALGLHGCGAVADRFAQVVDALARYDTG